MEEKHSKLEVLGGCCLSMRNNKQKGLHEEMSCEHRSKEREGPAYVGPGEMESKTEEQQNKSSAADYAMDD